MFSYHVVYLSNMESDYDEANERMAFFTAEAAIEGEHFSRLDVRKNGVTMLSITVAGVQDYLEDHAHGA